MYVQYVYNKEYLTSHIYAIQPRDWLLSDILV